MKFLHNIKKLNVLGNQVYAANSVGEVDSFPSTMTIHISNRCNLRCKMCAEWRKKDETDLSLDIIEKLKDVLPFMNSIYVTGGEPLLYPHLDELFKAAKEAGCGLSMVTNGTLLNDENIERIFTHGLFRLKFSLDAATQSTYSKIRGGNLEKPLQAIEKIAKIKEMNGLDWPIIEVGYVAMKSNIDELGKFIILANKIGVNEIYVSYAVAHFEEMVPESLFFMKEHSDKQMVMAKAIADSCGMRINLPRPFSYQPLSGRSAKSVEDTVCKAPWESMFLWANGNVSLCCGNGGDTGNLTDMDFDEMWNCKSRVAARKLVNSKNPPAACRNCVTSKQNPNMIGSLFSSAATRKMAEELLKEREYVESIDRLEEKIPA
ncbi:radical SAM/SPASM domain-containing protein [uncultured Pseudodesulfovibrio sp.]|uniref:radical SAM protein n=1 Tax=uncultured Pseudodesulfovibrio sp. TaxID=2035858 RepID=UPI0029C66DDB|nr:radical SAM/SPASM domain-containing protein [uncultured Pseudodesulfovibrio sp.]